MTDDWQPDHETVRAIDAVQGGAGDRAAVLAMLERVRLGRVSRDEQLFMQALAEALLEADCAHSSEAGGDRRRNAIYRATGLAGRAPDPHDSLRQIARTFHGFDGVDVASIIGFARAQGVVSDDPQAFDELDEEQARRKLREWGFKDI